MISVPDKSSILVCFIYMYMYLHTHLPVQSVHSLHPRTCTCIHVCTCVHLLSDMGSSGTRTKGESRPDKVFGES